MKFLKPLVRKGPSAQASISRGDAARDRRDWTSAAAAYKAALEAKPDLPGVWVQYGHAMKESGQAAGAVEAYREALRRRPGHVETQVHLAHALKRIGLNEEAIEAFEEVLALDPSDDASAQELFTLQKRLNLHAPARPGAGTPPLSPPGQDMGAAFLKERQANAANELRLSALQALHEDVQAENDILKNQVRGQQAEIEKLHARQEADDMAGLKRTLEDLRAELETLREERDDALRQMDALRAQMRDRDVRTDLARREFHRSEGQIALIKDMFLREGEL